jgi:hypothetical protein
MSLFSGPEQIVSAAALIIQQSRVHVKEVEQPDTVKENLLGTHIKVLAEKDIKIRCASAIEQNRRSLVYPQILRQVPPPVRGHIPGCHGAHQ